jgi:hypothetical protein
MDKRKRVIDVTVDEFVDAVVAKLADREEKETVTTDRLCEILKCSEAQIGRYGRAGMYEAGRIKKNCWNPKACKKFVATKWQQLLESGYTEYKKK